jgi:hypothetical protein
MANQTSTLVNYTTPVIKEINFIDSMVALIYFIQTSSFSQLLVYNIHVQNMKAKI